MSRQVFEDAARQASITIDTEQAAAIDVLIRHDGRGVYLWGDVGRGKSWLMDVYFAALATPRKRRIHFHEFLAELHVTISRCHGNLTAALQSLLGDADVVCFDEFHVHDPADGIFIGRLVTALFERNTFVVLTSNYPPPGLLPNPLFHDMFVPTIELIEQTLTVVPVNGDTDYRTRSTDNTSGFTAGAWVSPGTAVQLAELNLRRPQADESQTLRPAGHPIRAARAQADCLWFNFDDLCRATTAPADYLALSHQYRHWVISEIELESGDAREAAARFANLIDVLYDRDVTVVFVADHQWEQVALRSRQLPVETQRITSRLSQVRRIDRTIPSGST